MKSNIQKPLFDDPIVTHKGSVELIEQLRPILQTRISKTKYDRVVIAEQFLDHTKGKNPTDALHTFSINGSLGSTSGNSCVGLSLDLVAAIGKKANPYLAAARLSNRYQQFAGPEFCHVTPVVRFIHPSDSQDRGYIILDPSFHIAEPILLLENGPPYHYDMGGKKGVWTFTIEGDKVICQANAHPSMPPWTEEQINKGRMVYRLDRILNPENSSALPMFAIDRSYPIVSRHPDGSQVAHLNLELNERKMTWKVGDQKQPPVDFDTILKGEFLFDAKTADSLLIPQAHLNRSIYRICKEIEILDTMYYGYLDLLEKSDFLKCLLRDPYVRNPSLQNA